MNEQDGRTQISVSQVGGSHLCKSAKDRGRKDPTVERDGSWGGLRGFLSSLLSSTRLLINQAGESREKREAQAVGTLHGRRK